MSQPSPAPLLYDSGDLACGELLLELHLLFARLDEGQAVVLLSNDPAAPLDLRAWYNLRGYTYAGETDHAGRRAYLLRKQPPERN